MINETKENIVIIECERTTEDMGEAMKVILKTLRHYVVGNTIHIHKLVIKDKKSKKNIFITGELSIYNESDL
jgi:hypothetical protein